MQKITHVAELPKFTTMVRYFYIDLGDELRDCATHSPFIVEVKRDAESTEAYEKRFTAAMAAKALELYEDALKRGDKRVQDKTSEILMHPAVVEIFRENGQSTLRSINDVIKQSIV